MDAVVFTPRQIKVVLVAEILIVIAMTLSASFAYKPFLGMPNAIMYVIQLEGLLMTYLVLIVFVTNKSVLANTLSVSSSIGFITGIFEVTHILAEIFLGLGASQATIITGLFILGICILFGYAGFQVHDKSNLLHSMIAGSWSALVCMLLTVMLASSQLLWRFDQLERNVIGNIDFVRSGWSDTNAFVIADILESAFKVLVTGPILGVIFGLLGGLARLFVLKIRRKN